MWSIIRQESITTAEAGPRVPLARLSGEVAGWLTAPVAAPDPGALIDEDLLCRLLLVQMRAAGTVVAELRRWADESNRQLTNRGLLPGGAVDERAVWAEWETRSARWADDPDQRAQVRLLDVTLRALPRILSGAVPATDVMFPRSSMELVEGIYRNNPVTDTFNAVLADTAVAVVREIVRSAPGSRVRILEIGAGTGGGSVAVLEGLNPSDVETYCYTDMSQSFLMHAEQQYGPRHPYLEYRILDVEKPLAAQGIALGSFDLVLATNVLHATRDIRATLRNAKAALKENGVLLANELSTNTLFTHLTFGLLVGWWLYDDTDLRIPGCPGLYPDAWAEVLEDEGFDTVSFPAEALHDWGHQIVAARSDGLIRQGSGAPPVEKAEPVTQAAPRPERSSHFEDVVLDQLQISLGLDRARIDPDDAFMDYGVDSIIGVRLIHEINQRLGTDLATTDLFDHPTVRQLTRHIQDTYQVAAPAPAEPEPRTTVHKEPIAVVGMSGRFGCSPDVEALWEHLIRGDDLIRDVTRWDLPETSPGECRSGSFVEDFDRFDPAFFNLSGIEATYMDPQQRVFLEESWKALEDAGYAGAGIRGRRLGVYAGCQDSGYAQLFGGAAPAPAMWGNALSALPARISYLLDLQGPAVAVDTACSSSLVAIHLACQGLWGGETEMALAGGVALQATPQFYRVAGQAGMLSPTGRCHTFDDRADGFVPGEGAGVVVLKRLSDALADGDHIHGVISGSGINQDGASNGITAPSAKSQERLETSVYDAFGIDPDRIQMVEAHGTGTKLGDPIEYHALKRAFGRYTDRREFCALGSIKSNLGHTITAAGVAGVLKVLLSLRHKRIPPSINFEVGNTHIDVTNSPFYVNTAARPWTAGNDGIRRAAVSSFGVSGTNAHLVLEEAPHREPVTGTPVARLVALSAETPEQLHEMAVRLIAHSENHPGLDLAAVSFTLLLGRKHLQHRLAVVVRDQAELAAALRHWLDTGAAPERAGTRTELPAVLAARYLAGDEPDWAELFAGQRTARVPLPTYPFARDRYWVAAAPVPVAAPAGLHPLVHVNESTFGAQRYRTTFAGDEHFLTDHVVRGDQVLPGVACLEMARAAAVLAEPDRDRPGLTLRNVAWARPIVVAAQPRTLTTTLTPGTRDEIAFEITSADDGVHSQGLIVRGSGEPATMDVERLRAGCDRAEIPAADLYPLYENVGFTYGPSHRGIERLHVGADQVLVRLVLPAGVRATLGSYVLHPSLLDSMLQGSLGLGLASGTDVTGTKPSLPFALDELEILGPGAETMWACIRYSAGTDKTSPVFKLDIDLSDDQGQIRARVRGISYRVLNTAEPAPAVTFLPQWQRAEPIAGQPEPSRHVVLTDAPLTVRSAEVLRLSSTATGIAERYTDCTVQALGHLQRLLGGPPTLVQLAVAGDSRSILGLLLSAQREDPNLFVQAVLTEPGDDVAARLADARRYAGSCLRFRGAAAETVGWAEHTVAPQRWVPWKNGGVYLITGGLGGVGMLVAQDMVARAGNVTVVLAGRSPLRPGQELPPGVHYVRADVSDAAAVRRLVDGIICEHGALHGIVHGAGIIRDNLLRAKTPQEVRDVLAPKVSGVVHLDEASRDVPLDFFVSFAAAAGVFGNTGQADYAAANAFLDAYTWHRSDLVERGERSGASVSIDWPLWAEGGMRVDARTEAVMRDELGMTPMPTATGIAALYAALDAAHGQVLVIDGNAPKIRQTVLGALPAPVRPALAAVRPAPAAAHPKVVGYLRDVLAEVIQVPAHRLDAAAPFDRYGIDSVLALSVTNRLEDDFGSLPKALLFEHRCLDDLSRYFLGAHADTLTSLLDIGTMETPAAAPVAVTAPRVAAPPGPVAEDAIAVIGMSGRYPGAADLDELWANLVAARDAVTDVPEGRWERDGETPDWGGFLDGVADFDPLLFQIPPAEAAFLDPQTRLFLETVWNLLESAGYPRQRLRDRHGSRVGVYVGTMYQQYQLLASDVVRESITSVMSSSSIANRVSHFFDLRGPSMAVDTTCSSSLVAIHLACEELRHGGSELMIAGGVNLTLHPKKYRGLQMTGLMGSSPDSRAFHDGDGFVPAEGVGAVLLKPLSRAKADGDEILAVIRSSAVNHKGRTTGPMVPGVEQQEELIEENLRRAGVHPRTVGYAEASANGSPLGDAIEFAALKNVFARHTGDEGFCALGTVKSTLGNLEAASGVAQLSKVALQLRHGTLVPPLRRGPLNPGLDFGGTAFYLPDEAVAWQRPVVGDREYPRRATISAFGAGGSNAHLVVEEYDAGVRAPAVDGGPRIVVLSARTAEQLTARARQTLGFVLAHPDVSLADLAHTLQVGREPMEHRLALVAGKLDEVVAGLEHHLQDGMADTAPVPLYVGDTRRDGADIGALLTGAVGAAMRQQLIAADRPADLALFWVRGGEVPWESVPQPGGPRRIVTALPTYPFERQRHWLNAASAPVPDPEPALVVAAKPVDGIAAMVADLLGVPAAELHPDTRLTDLGFSSILAPHLLQRIQAGIAPDAGLADLADCVTTRDLIRRFPGAGKAESAPAAGKAENPAAATPEVVRLNGSSTGRPVFWFHGGLGGVEAYGAVAATVERPFYGIQARGWLTGAEPLTGIHAMAAHYAGIVRVVQPDGPYDLGGYSLGGMLAYEVARQMQEAGDRVETITMLDTMYGDEVKERTMSRKDMLLQQVNALLQAAAVEKPFIAAYEVDLTGGDNHLLDQLITLAGERGLSGTPESLRKHVEHHVRVLEAYQVLAYDPPPLPEPGAVTCFYFRNRSGLFYGELEPVLSTQDDAKALDHVNYWAEWQKRIPDFQRTDVDSPNHFLMLTDEASLSAIRAFCKVLYSSVREKNRIANGKKWVSRRRNRK